MVNPRVPRPVRTDGAWRRWCIAVSLAIGIHVVVIWLAWGVLKPWVMPAPTQPVVSNSAGGRVTQDQIQRAIDESPLIMGVVGSAPTASEVLGTEDVASPGWLLKPLSLEQTPLPSAPRHWWSFGPPVASIAFDRAPPKPARQ